MIVQVAEIFYQSVKTMFILYGHTDALVMDWGKHQQLILLPIK